jgi:hypothetical protein
VYVAVMNKEDYQRVFKKADVKQYNKKMEFLHQLPPLKNLSNNMLRKMIHSFVV